jgi:hypothetical protein
MAMHQSTVSASNSTGTTHIIFHDVTAYMKASVRCTPKQLNARQMIL